METGKRQKAKTLRAVSDCSGERLRVILFVEGELGNREAGYIREALKNADISLGCLPELTDRALETALWEEQKTAVEQCLLIAAADRALEFARSHGLAALAYQNPALPRQRFEGQRMIVEGFEEVDARFLVRQYERCRGIPWMIAQTERCYIRELSLEDIPALFELYSKPHVTDYMEPLYEREEEIAYQKLYIENIYGMYGFGMWLVFEKEGNRLIGRAGLEPKQYPHEDVIELGYVIDPEYQHRGYATEVCRKIIEIAGADYGIETLHTLIEPANGASIALAERLGFHFIGNMHMENTDFAHYILQ